MSASEINPLKSAVWKKKVDATYARMVALVEAGDLKVENGVLEMKGKPVVSSDVLLKSVKPSRSSSGGAKKTTRRKKT